MKNQKLGIYKWKMRKMKGAGRKMEKSNSFISTSFGWKENLDMIKYKFI